MKIGIDIDGVLTDERRYITDYATKYFYESNIPYKIDKAKYYDEEFFSISRDTYNNLVCEYIMNYAKNVQIRAYAAEIIHRFKKLGNEIYIITSRIYTTYENEHKETMQNLVRSWLKLNKVEYDKIIYANDKLNVCKKENIGLMIEDKPANIVDISSIIPVVCYDNEYNDTLYGKNIIRCYSWYDIYKNIEEIIK